VPEDPQVVAMLVAAVILAAGTFSLLYVVVKRRTSSRAVWILAIVLGIALGLSVGGFLRGLHGGSSVDTEEAVAQAADVVEDTPAEQGEAPQAAEVGGAAATVEPEVEAPAAGEASPPEVAAIEPAPEVAEPEAVAGARPADVKAWGREVRAVTTDSDRCNDPKELVRVWSGRPTVGPDDPERMRAYVATKWLERCRTRIAEKLARRISYARIDARREFAETLSGRLREKGEYVKVTLAGPIEEKLRITGGSFDEAGAKAMLDGGLRAELAVLGFTRVTFVRYTKRHRFRIKPEAEAEVVHKELEGLGIGKPFEM
jgi:hypothetical protein